jgi:plasmid stability protein
MADVKIRNLDDGVVHAFRTRAKANGRSLEEELRQTLAEVLRQGRLAHAEKLRKLREDIRAEFGEQSDSTPLIREDRDRRG